MNTAFVVLGLSAVGRGNPQGYIGLAQCRGSRGTPPVTTEDLFD